MERVLSCVDHSIGQNRRQDGLFHAYNLVTFHEDTISLRTLYEMLEGQVAVLSSGYLDTEESLHVLNALKESKLYREDQNSYLLYPDRPLPRFTEKNRIPGERLEESALLKKLLQDGEGSVVIADNAGHCFFNSNLRNASELAGQLERLDEEVYGALAVKEKQLILGIYEEIFDHQSFTGRSGTFFAYEGLGSIYWHMVSKLLLAVGECHRKGSEAGADDALLGRIKEHYYDMKAGIGLYKTPAHYGAFPTDAYSHTPAGAGVKQPGMTGQVKEDFLSRMLEMGVSVKEGALHFDFSLLNHNELLERPGIFEYIDLEGRVRQMDLEPGQLAYTICQVPVLYRKNEQEQLVIRYSNGEQAASPGHSLDLETSERIFRRTGEVESITCESPFF